MRYVWNSILWSFWVNGLDCKSEQERMKSSEDLEDVSLDLLDSTKTVKIEKELGDSIRREIT